MAKQVFHYTVYQVLQEILESGEIKTTAILIGKKEKPAVWFSSNPDWEESANKPVRNIKTRKLSRPLSRNGLLKKGFPPVRIEVEPTLPFLNWGEFKRKSGISKRMARGLEIVARRDGAKPEEWLALFSPVGAEHWLAIEIWDGKRWVDMLSEADEEDQPEIVPDYPVIGNC